MARFNRRAALAVLGASAVMGVGYALREILGSPVLGVRLTDGGMMRATPADMSLYMDMFNRHTELARTVDEIPGGVRTTTESNAPDLVAKLHAHVSSMYSHVGQGSGVMCMSQSLPTLFRNAGGYRRQLTLNAHGRNRRGNLRRSSSHRRYSRPRA
jgi:hypothetical protein